MGLSGHNDRNYSGLVREQSTLARTRTRQGGDKKTSFPSCLSVFDSLILLSEDQSSD